MLSEIGGVKIFLFYMKLFYHYSKIVIKKKINNFQFS
jgi:hypothetical protein